MKKILLFSLVLIFAFSVHAERTTRFRFLEEPTFHKLCSGAQCDLYDIDILAECGYSTIGSPCLIDNGGTYRSQYLKKHVEIGSVTGNLSYDEGEVCDTGTIFQEGKCVAEYFKK
ncbi:hypothetical protein COB57_05005 [Candidatus Peregrinibacteria bacterium]|nr:MAG: hypothetical protein COB57_05005 [Candidatus Peregrinibacteria bacterium]